MSDEPAELIVYACPTGPLAAQIAAFFAASLAQHGPNSAHAYPPHITLTGFFHDDAASIALYCAALADARSHALPIMPEAPITISGLLLRPDFIGLTIDSLWLRALSADFALKAASPLRRDAIRLKDWLHLSLAYSFAAEQFQPLQVLALAMIDLATPVGWELRLYQRLPAEQWLCHAAWPL
jgi:hypothetical protein